MVGKLAITGLQPNSKSGLTPLFGFYSFILEPLLSMELNQPNYKTTVWISSGPEYPETNTNSSDHMIAEEANNRWETIVVYIK